MNTITEDLLTLAFKQIHSLLLIRKVYGEKDFRKLASNSPEWELWVETKKEVEREFRTGK